MDTRVKPLRKKEFDPSIFNFFMLTGLVTSLVFHEWSFVILISFILIVFFSYRFTVTLSKGEFYRAIAYAISNIIMMAFFWEALRPKHW